MRCEHVEAVLSGEAPQVPVEEHLATCQGCSTLWSELHEVDALAAELPELELPGELALDTWAAMELEVAAAALPVLEPPRDLLERTLAAYERERDGSIIEHPSAAAAGEPSSNVVRGPWLRRVGGAAVAMLAAALALVVVLPAEDGPAPAERLVERGVGERLPEVSLKVAVERDGSMARHDLQRRYTSGDTLYFRAQVDQPAWVGLVRVDASGAHLVHAEQIAAGEVDLRLDRGPLAWRIEPGETDAVFALVATAGDRQPAELVSALHGVNADVDEVCAAVVAENARCSAVPVGVQP